MAKYEIKVLYDNKQSFTTEKLDEVAAKKLFVMIRKRFPEDEGYRFFVTKFVEEDVTEYFKRDTAVSVTFDVYVNGVQHVDQTFTLTYPSIEAANRWMDAQNRGYTANVELVQSSVMHNT